MFTSTPTYSPRMQQKPDITQLLIALADGKSENMDKILPLVYDELHKMAHFQLRGERQFHTLNTTALVHEAYFKLVNLDRLKWQNKAHFLAIAAQSMRQILINYAVKRRALKRGGGQNNVSLSDWDIADDQRAENILALDEALLRLEKINGRHAKMIEFRFFGGLSIAETAEVLEISVATVKRDWQFARAWLNKELDPNNNL